MSRPTLPVKDNSQNDPDVVSVKSQPLETVKYCIRKNIGESNIWQMV